MTSSRQDLVERLSRQIERQEAAIESAQAVSLEIVEDVGEDEIPPVGQGEIVSGITRPLSST